jgi:serine phosphatase RsbU (regulator of sigma subunit)
MGIVKDAMSTFRPRLEYGIAGRAKPGERLSGDLAAVRELPEGFLLSVADGLGHGPEAAEAAAVAIATLDTGPDQSVSRLMEMCHAALAGTRGAVLALAALDACKQTLSWLAVGNVEGRLIRRTADGHREAQTLLMHSGIVGHRLPNLHPSTLALQPGDVVAMATDGIRSGFEAEIRLDLSPQQAATRVLARCARESDDALVLVGHWIGLDGGK